MIAPYAVWLHVSGSGVIAARLAESYRVFDPRLDSVTRVRIGDRLTRNPVSATAVLLWNRAATPTASGRATVKLPNRRVVAVRVLTQPLDAQVACDLSGVDRGVVGVTWKHLGANEGLALHIAYEGWPAEPRLSLPSVTFWRANARPSDVIMLYCLGLILFMAVFVWMPGVRESRAAPPVMCLFSLVLCWFIASRLPGYMRLPPKPLVAAIAAHYPQPLLSTDDR